MLALALVLRLAWSLYAARDPAGLNDPLTYLVSATGSRTATATASSSTAPPPPTSRSATRLSSRRWSARRAHAAERRAEDDGRAAGADRDGLGVARLADRRAPLRRSHGASGGGALVALFPGLLLYSGALLSETLFVSLLLAAIAVVVDGGHGTGDSAPSRRRLLAFGVLTAAWRCARAPAGRAAVRSRWCSRSRSRGSAGAARSAPAQSRSRRPRSLIAPWTIAQRDHDGRLRPDLDEHRRRPLHRPQPRRERGVRASTRTASRPRD